MSNTYAQRLDNLDARIDRLEALIVAALDGKAPAKAVVPAAPKVTRKTTKKAQPKAAPKATKALCRQTRLAFVAAAAAEGVDFSGCSTKAIAGMCLEDPTLVPAGFRIGEGYAALLG